MSRIGPLLSDRVIEHPVWSKSVETRTRIGP